MQFTTIPQLFNINVCTNYWMDSYVAELLAIWGVANTTSTSEGVEGGVVFSNEVVGKSYIHTENSQIASISIIFTSTYHTKQLNPWLYSPTSRVVKYSWLSAYPREMEPFKHHPSTTAHLKSLRNKPEQKQLGQISAPIPAWIVY